MAPSPHHKSHKNKQHQQNGRSSFAVSSLLTDFRNATNYIQMSDALALLAMRLVNTEDREIFAKLDGATSIVDHLEKMCQEQATLGAAWNYSKVLGFIMENDEVKDSLQFTVIALCHMSIDSKIAIDLLSFNLIARLFEIYESLEDISAELQVFLLEAIRNLCFTEPNQSDFPSNFKEKMWRLVLEDESIEKNTLSADILCNLSCDDPALASATQERICQLLDLFFKTSDNSFKISITDLLCNLSCHASYCLFIIYELEERKPLTHKNHSGVVYLTVITESMSDYALRTSMESFTHNLAWSDPNGKRNIQKLAVSHYLSSFSSST